MISAERKTYPIPPEYVVRQLFDFMGESVLDKLDKVIEGNKDLKQIFIIGLPGSGKTTVLVGLRRLIIKNYPQIKEVISLPFDKFRKEFLQVKRSEGWSATAIPQLPFKIQKEFGQFLVKSFKINLLKQDTLYIDEFPGVGEHERGQAVLKAAGKRIKKTKKIETFVIFLIPHERVLERAKRVREITKNAADDYELLLRLKEADITFREPTEDDRGQTILIEYFDQMADSSQIDMIKNEVEPRVDENYERVKTDPNFEVIASLLPQLLKIPPGVVIENQEEWTHIIKFFLYANWLLKQYGFPEQAVAIVLNQLLGNVTLN